MIKKLSRTLKETHEYYAEAIAHLGMPILNKIYSGLRSKRCPECGTQLTEKRERTIYGWSADPDVCETARKNPIDRIRKTNKEFLKRGVKCPPIAIADLFASDVGATLNFKTTTPDKDTLAAEMLDDYPALVALHRAMKKRENKIEVREKFRNLEEELRQTLISYERDVDNT